MGLGVLIFTSFETILLHYIVTAVISCAFKKVSKLVNFCAAILILNMEENMQHFGVLCFIVSKKAKMQLKHKRFVQCMEKVL